MTKACKSHAASSTRTTNSTNKLPAQSCLVSLISLFYSFYSSIISAFYISVSATIKIPMNFASRGPVPGIWFDNSAKGGFLLFLLFAIFFLGHESSYEHCRSLEGPTLGSGQTPVPCEENASHLLILFQHNVVF